MHQVVIGVTVVKVAHVRRCYSRMLFVRALSARGAGDGFLRLGKDPHGTQARTGPLLVAVIAPVTV
jgi:hypothetical protein